MKIQTLEYFIALTEARSINEAAQKLYIAQPSLTKALQLFEKELGVSLFYRTKAGITLTPAGKKILPEARKIVDYYNGWLTLGEEKTLQALDVYVHSSFSDFILPDVVLRFREKYPDVHVKYTTRNNLEQCLSRDTQKPVIAMFICDEQEQLARLTRIQGNPPLILFQGEYHCLVSTESPLAKKEAIVPEDLKDHYLVLPLFEGITAEGCFLSPVIRSIIDAASQRKIIEVESLSNVTSLVAGHPEAYAVSFYPALERYKEFAAKKLIHIPFQNQATRGALCLFYSRQAYQQHPAIREVVNAVHEASEQFLTRCGLRPPAG